MRDIYRLLTTLSVMTAIATVGSFLIDFRSMVDTLDSVQYAQREVQRDIPTPIATNAPPDQRTPQMPECSLLTFEAIIKRLRGEQRSKQRRGAGRLGWLGADRNFDYYYDFATDEAFCRRHTRPTGPMVRSGGADRRKRRKRQVVLWAVLVVAMSAVSLVIVRYFRLRR